MRPPIVVVFAVYVACALAAVGLAHETEPYGQKSVLENAYIHLELLRNRLSPPVYTENNIYDGLKVPQYDEKLHDYRGTVYLGDSPDVFARYTSAMAVVEAAADNGDISAMLTIADYNMFGYVARPDYGKALSYYHRVVDSQPNGHAYFMLGLAYSTGLFGDIEKDPARALLYYQFAMENGSDKATMALAYKNLYGLGVPTNCELALHYYTRLAQLGREYIGENYDDIKVSYNLRVPDFNGGLYGNKLSESGSLIFSRYHQVESYLFNENNLDYDFPSYADQYYEALALYEGDYFRPANHAKAFEVVSECMKMYRDVGGSFRSMPEMRFFHRCRALQGHMYLHGQGVEKNVTEAARILNQLRAVSPEATADLGYIVEKGLNGSEPNATKAMEIYAQAAKIKSHKGRTALARLLLQERGFNPVSNPELPQILTSFKTAAGELNTEALYYVGELLRANVGAYLQPSAPYQCETTIVYYKVFVERLESLFVPELEWAFRELCAGRYKNALLGYLIGAELGLVNSQVSAAYLLYQLQPLLAQFNFLPTVKVTHSDSRVKSAISYLEQASTQSNIDATILLGDIYFYGIEGTQLSPNYDMAYTFYHRAANQHSSHGCYSLAYMYEYGLGPINNTVDYFMAKRFYDLSLLYQGDDYMRLHASKNKVPINLALLRLRLKYMFSPHKNKDSSADENYGWFSAFRSISKKKEPSPARFDQANERARAHHEGSSYDTEEDYDTGDYLVIAITLMFFLVFFIQSVMQMRRLRNPNNNNNQPNNRDDENDEQPPNGWMGNQFNFRRGNFEFHFFAI